MANLEERRATTRKTCRTDGKHSEREYISCVRPITRKLPHDEAMREGSSQENLVIGAYDECAGFAETWRLGLRDY